MNRTIAVGIILCASCAASQTPATEGNEKASVPCVKRIFIISGHRGGGRVHAPDNSMPNVLFAVNNGLTAVEVDFRLTKDGKLVLWHDSSVPRQYVRPGVAGDAAINTLSSDEVRKIRYSVTVGGKTWKNVRIVFGDELAKAAKGKINVHLDVKDVPAKKIIEFIRKHDIQKQCMVMAKDINYLQKICRAELNVCLEYTDNTLGRRMVDGKLQWYPPEKQRELYHALMKKLAATGIDALCTKGLSEEKVAICHQYGIMVRTSAGHMKVGVKPDRYLRLGVDYALTDDPLLMAESVLKLCPGLALSKPGQTFFDLVRSLGAEVRGGK